MGLSSKKTTSTQNTTQNTSSSSTPTNPSWVTDPIQNLVGQIGQLGSTNPQNYVAGPSGLQQQAFGQGAGSLGGISNNFGEAVGAIGAANGATTPMVSGQSFKAASLLDNLDSYVNPMLENVVRTSLDNYDVDAGARQAQYAAQGAKNGAFGGSRYALGEGALGAYLSRGRATTESGLRSDAWDKAYGYSNLDADRRQAADLFGAQSAMTAGLANQSSQNSAIDRYLTSAGLLSGIGSASDASNRGNIDLLSQLGGDQRDIAQSQATAPLSLLQAQQSLLSGLPLGMFSGQNATGTGTSSSTGTSVTSDPLGALGGILGGLGGIASGIGAGGGVSAFFK